MITKKEIEIAALLSQKLFRQENLKVLSESIMIDEYDDETQAQERKYPLYNPPELVEFVKRNIREGKVLEIGCGCGKSFDFFPITHAIEPNKYRYEKARKKVTEEMNLIVELGFAEYIPFNVTFDSVIMIGTLGHLRSPFESFIEINRVLRPYGIFILDTYEGYTGFPGLLPLSDNLIEILNDFGFKLVEKREWKMKGTVERFFHYRVGICVEKFEDFNSNHLRHLQLIKKENSLYKPVNFFPETRDYKLL